jgi:parvulin-like peptidyl-prolyl isomerase
MKKSFSICVLSILAHLCFVNTGQAQPDDGVVLHHDGIAISFEEAFNYSLRHTNPDAYEASLSKPQATTRVLQNLYVLKRVAALAEGSPSFSASESQYLVNDIYRRQLLERYLADEIAVRMELIDWRGLAKAEYAQRKANFVSPEEVRVEHLLVSMEDLSFDGFVARVREVESQITSENDFVDLIAQYSDDPSAARNNGDLGYFPRGRMQPAFSDAAFSLLEPGEIVGPVMTSFGAHFIRFIDRKEEQSLPFGEVELRLIKQIKKEMQAQLREAILAEIIDEVQSDLVEIDEGALLERFLHAYEAHKDTVPQ